MSMYYSKLEVVLVELYLLVERLTNLTFPSTSSKVFPYFWTHIYLYFLSSASVNTGEKLSSC